MFIKKTIAAVAFACFALLLSLTIASCSGGSDKSSTSADSSSMKAASADTSMAASDTTKLDTASTRPVKSPN